MKDNGKSITKQSFECKGIHPYPLFFKDSQPLIPEVKYLLSLHMVLIKKEGNNEVQGELKLTGRSDIICFTVDSYDSGLLENLH